MNSERVSRGNGARSYNEHGKHMTGRNGSNGTFYWPVIAGVFLAIVQAFWGLAYSSLQGENNRLNGELRDRLTIREFEEYKASVRRDVDIAKVTLSEIQKDMGLRVATITKVESLEKRVDIQFQRMEEIARSTNSIVTPAKAMEDLRRDLEGLRTLFVQQHTRAPAIVRATP